MKNMGEKEMVKKRKKFMFAILMVAVMCLTCCSKSSESIGDEEKTDVPATIESYEATTEITEDPVIVGEYTILQTVSNFSEGRAWILYREGDESGDDYRYGIIDTNGFIIYSIGLNELDGLNTSIVGVTEFSDGLSCLYSTKNSVLNRNEGLVIVNREGEEIFNSFGEDENSHYYYLGMGDGIVLAYENFADFSSNNHYVCEIDSSGEIVNRYEIDYDDELWNHVFYDPAGYKTLQQCNDFSYFGNGIFCGRLERGDKLIYNQKNHVLFPSSEYMVYDYTEDITILGRNYSNDIIIYKTDSNNLENLEDFEKWRSDDNKVEICKDYYLNVFVNEGIINTSYGMYNYQGDLITSFKEDWIVKSIDSFSGGYAAIEIEGADGLTYITVLDSTGETVYEPKKIDSFLFPAWHGYVCAKIDNEIVFFDPNGEITDLSDIAVQNLDFTISDKVVSEGIQTIQEDDFGSYYSYVSDYEISEAYLVENYDKLPEDYQWNNNTESE